MVTRTMTDLGGMRRSPAAHLTAVMAAGSTSGERGVELRELPFLAMAGVRVSPATASADAVTDVLGIDLPSRCGEVTGEVAGVSVLWLGPDEFLVVAGDQMAPVPGLDTRSDREPGALPCLATHPLVQRLCTVLAERALPGQVVDVSANRTTLELSGPSAREVLEKGCHVDLHPREFRPGTAVSTLLGAVPVVLWQSDAQVYRVLPRASFADHTVRWLLDAMREFSGPRVP